LLSALTLGAVSFRVLSSSIKLGLHKIKIINHNILLGDFIIEIVLVPKDRIKVIKDQKIVKKLESSIKIKLSFEENSVLIEGEGVELFQAKNIVKAIGRGFSPEKAFRLLSEEESLEIIEITGFNDKKLKVIKSRLIGTKGKTRRLIENFSGCSVSVYGKTVCIIGNYEQMNIAREAIKMIIRGSKHSKVYGFLQQANL
jgi:ribosomal RNA assembly protein